MPADQKRFRVRAILVLILLLGGLGLVHGRAIQLQVYQHAELAELAAGRYLNDVRIPARRGNIYDRNGKRLATSVEVPSVFANPTQIEDPRQTARRMAPILDADLDLLYRRLSSERRFVWLKRHATPDVAARVQALGIRGVAITDESRRYYPNKEIAGHVVGFAGIDSNGLEGIERSMDEVLRGEPQVVATLRDARGNSVLRGELDPEHRAAGADVFLTLDMRIQHAAEVALQEGVAKTRAKAAWAVVLEVATAELLAIAVEPHFNPNAAGTAPAERRRNRAITDMFEPGSTFKPLVIAAALDAGAVKADDRIFCHNGAYTIGSHTIRDGRPNGWLSLTGIVQKSSNVGVVKCGEALGREKLASYLYDFGFGSRSGLRFPGESPGLVRKPSTWSDVGLATISFGHGIAVSGLQLAAAYRVLAAGGNYRAPTLVKKVRSNRPTVRIEPTRDRQVLNPAVVAQVVPMMEAAVSSEGTAWRGAIDGYRVAGKTGTAQKIDMVAGGYSSDRFTAVFGGFLPAEAPRVVIVVAVDEPQGVHSGGAVAAPIFATIAKAAMQHLGGVPATGALTAALQRARGEAERRERNDARRGIVDEPVPIVSSPPPPGTVPSFVGMTAREALQRFTEVGAGLDLELIGSGKVVQQKPAAGSAASGSHKLTLTLRDTLSGRSRL